METAQSVRDAFDLTGRVALVTGAGRESVARRRGAGRSGATVVCADIDAEAAAETAGGIMARAGGAESAELDVRSGAPPRLVGHITSRHGGLHVMCNIAGIMIDSSIIDLDPDEFDRILASTSRACCTDAGRREGDGGAGAAAPSSTWPRPRC